MTKEQKIIKAKVGLLELASPAYCDTFYVGNMKGVGRIYEQTFIDTYSRENSWRTVLWDHSLSNSPRALINILHREIKLVFVRGTK